LFILAVSESAIYLMRYPSGHTFDGFISGTGAVFAAIMMSVLTLNLYTGLFAAGSWCVAIFLSVVTAITSVFAGPDLTFPDGIRLFFHIGTVFLVASCWFSPSQVQNIDPSDKYAHLKNRLFLVLAVLVCIVSAGDSNARNWTARASSTIPFLGDLVFGQNEFWILFFLSGVLLIFGPALSSFASRDRHDELANREAARASVATQLEALQSGLVGRWNGGNPDVPVPAPVSVKVTGPQRRISVTRLR
jgi:hypothetical protein